MSLTDQKITKILKMKYQEATNRKRQLMNPVDYYANTGKNPSKAMMYLINFLCR